MTPLLSSSSFFPVLSLLGPRVLSEKGQRGEGSVTCPSLPHFTGGPLQGDSAQLGASTFPFYSLPPPLSLSPARKKPFGPHPFMLTFLFPFSLPSSREEEEEEDTPSPLEIEQGKSQGEGGKGGGLGEEGDTSSNLPTMRGGGERRKGASAARDFQSGKRRTEREVQNRKGAS